MEFGGNCFCIGIGKKKKKEGSLSLSHLCVHGFILNDTLKAYDLLHKDASFLFVIVKDKFFPKTLFGV